MSRRVLLIDDEADIRAIAQFALERVGGLEVITGSSCAEAIALAKAQDFDAVILDVMMPGAGGIETAHLLRELPAFERTPIVLLTAKSLNDAMLVGAPVDAVLAKPFDPMTLANQLKEALRWSQ